MVETTAKTLKDGEMLMNRFRYEHGDFEAEVLFQLLLNETRELGRFTTDTFADPHGLLCAGRQALSNRLVLLNGMIEKLEALQRKYEPKDGN